MKLEKKSRGRREREKLLREHILYVMIIAVVWEIATKVGGVGREGQEVFSYITLAWIIFFQAMIAYRFVIKPYGTTLKRITVYDEKGEVTAEIRGRFEYGKTKKGEYFLTEGNTTVIYPKSYSLKVVEYAACDDE